MIFGHNTVQIYHNTKTMYEISRNAYFVWGWAKWFASVHHWRNICPYGHIWLSSLGCRDQGPRDVSLLAGILIQILPHRCPFQPCNKVIKEILERNRWIWQMLLTIRLWIRWWPWEKLRSIRLDVSIGTLGWFISNVKGARIFSDIWVFQSSMSDISELYYKG